MDPAGGAPLAGAFVMVGTAPDQPFAGNSGTTGGDGTIVFSDPALTTPAVVTAGTADRAYVTVTTAPADSVRIGLPLRAAGDGPPPPVARVTGTATGIPAVNNNGALEMGFVLPAFDLDVLLGSGQAPFAAPSETVEFPIFGPVEMPGIVVIPTQIEFFVLTFEKPDYAIDLTGGTTQSLYCPAGRISFDDLAALQGDDIFDLLNAIQMLEFGIERDVPINNGAVIDVDVDHPADTPVSVEFAGVPAGDMIRVLSGATLPGPGGLGERFVLYDGKSRLVDSGTVVSAASVVPAGDLADATDAVVAMRADSSSADAYASGIIDRDGFVPPATLTADSFFLVPDVLQAGATVTHGDPLNPGISPVPTWTTSIFALVAVDGDTTVTPGIEWQVLSPAADLGFTLPALPPSAPPALPDPASTPGSDQLELTLTVTDHPGGAQAVLDDPLGEATHFTLRTIAIEAPTTGAGEADGDAGGAPLAVRPRLGPAYPDPAPASRGGARIELPLLSVASGPAAVRIYTAGGRLVRVIEFAATAGVPGTVTWDGRDAAGRAVPAGTYFARLAGAPGPAEKIVVSR